MTKALMIGLDGATYTLLDRFMEDGTMPFLKSVVQRGVRADLMSTRNPLTPPAWTTMITGRSPAAHGIYDFLRPDALEDGNIFLKVNDSRHVRAETIWSIANRHGKKFNALNFFGHSPAPELDGNVISGFVPWKHLRHGTYPRALFDEIKAFDDFDYRLLGMDISEEKKCIQGLEQGEHEPWITLQDERDSAWIQITRYLMERDGHELTGVVLDGSDKIQHLFWRFLDPDHMPDEQDAWFAKIRGMCLEYYANLDRNLQSLIEGLDEDIDVILTSDHGFGPTTEVVYINEWLAREGYLTWSDSAQTDGSAQITADKMKDHLGMVDWKKTVAFCPTPSSNAIYIKKDMGSGTGVTEEGYLDLVLEIRDKLLAYREKDGSEVFTRVDLNKLRGSSFVEPCPDIGLALRDGGFVSILKSDEIVIQRPHTEGTHRPRGIFIGMGPSFAKGTQVEPMQITDIAPLLLTLIGVPVPRDLEGTVPEAAFATAVDVQTGGMTHTQDNADSDAEPSDEERQALLNQMKLLGYMD